MRMVLSYAIDYQTPRETLGLSRNDVGMLLADKKIRISSESLACYERGVRDPSPEILMELSKIYKEPFLTQRYCKYKCGIGQAYSYEILDNIDIKNLSNIGLKLLEEHRESHDVLNELLILITNKEKPEDLTIEEELRLKKVFHELLDTEHTIEIFKIALNKLIDVEEEIQEHNEKCVVRGYAKRKSPMAATTGL